MNTKDTALATRRSLLTGMAFGAAGLSLGTSMDSEAQEDMPHFRPARHPEDDWLDDMPGNHRAFVDSSRPMGGVEALQYASNILTAHVGVYGGAESDYAMIVCFRRFATPLGYGDAVWEKYGGVFNRIAEFPDPATGEAFAVNPGNIADRRDLPNRGNTIDSLGERVFRHLRCGDPGHLGTAVAHGRRLRGRHIQGSRRLGGGEQPVRAGRRYDGDTLTGVWLQPAGGRLVASRKTISPSVRRAARITERKRRRIRCLFRNHPAAWAMTAG